LDKVNLGDEIDQEAEVSGPDVDYQYSMLIGYEGQQKTVVFDVKRDDSTEVAEEKVHNKCHRYYSFLLKRLHWTIDHMKFVTSYEIAIRKYKNWFNIPEQLEHEWTEEEWLDWAAERQWNFEHNVEARLCFVFDVKFNIDEETTVDGFYEDMHTLWDKGMNYPWGPRCILMFDWKRRPYSPIFREGIDSRSFWREKVVECYDAIFQTDYTEEWLEQNSDKEKWAEEHKKSSYEDMSVYVRWLIHNRHTVTDDYVIDIVGLGDELRNIGTKWDYYVKITAKPRHEGAKDTRELIKFLTKLLVEPAEKYMTHSVDEFCVVVVDPVEEVGEDLMHVWGSYGMKKNPYELPQKYHIGEKETTVKFAFVDTSYADWRTLIPWGRTNNYKRWSYIPNNMDSVWKGVLLHSRIK
jgi:hypothetical protein